MKIQLTRRGDYAVRAVICLAAEGSDKVVKSHSVASEMDIPVGFMPQVFGDLVRAGIVRAHHGQRGGYELQRDATEISLLDVVEAVEGPIGRERCVMHGDDCPNDTPCAVHHVWMRLREALSEALASATIAELAAQHQAVAPGRVGGDPTLT